MLALYTDDDEHVVELVRPALTTGITDVVTAPDLLDRSLLVELEPIPHYMTKQQLKLEWEAARPRILGALLDAVVCVLRLLSR